MLIVFQLEILNIMFLLLVIGIRDLLYRICNSKKEHIERFDFALDVLFELNKDRLSEYEILNYFQEMIMVANLYKSNKKTATK